MMCQPNQLKFLIPSPRAYTLQWLRFQTPGTLTQTFNVTMKISGGYISTQTVTALAPGASQQVTFNPWTAVTGIDTVTVYTQLAGDANTANDTLSKMVNIFFDVATISIDVPVYAGVGAQNPKATIRNNGGDASAFNVTMTISGGYSSTKNVTLLKTDSIKQITFDTWTATLETDTISVYTQLAGDLINSNDTLTKIVNVYPLKKVYCYVAYDPTGAIARGPAYSYLQRPGQIVSLANQSVMGFLSAGTWGALNKWFGVDNNTNVLMTLDTVTGARDSIGNIGMNISGIAYDYTSNKLYGVSWDGGSSSLYTISTATGSPIFIGQSTSDYLINLACDTNGNLYSVGIATDTLYSVNKTNGLATPIGYIGFHAAYSQGMTFNRMNNFLYMAAYNSTTASGELRTVDVSTGASTLIGSFADGAEITAFAIPRNVNIAVSNAGVSAHITPVSACGLGNEDIKVAVQNFGSAPISNIPIHYKINGGTAVNETVTSTIPAGGFVYYTFTTQANLSTQGLYSIKVYTSLTGDAMIADDTLTFNVENVANASIPYSMGFEPSEDFNGWTIIDANADNYTWSIVSTGGHNGPYCAKYVYNPASAADDWIVSKCLLLDATRTYKLSYWYRCESANYPEKLRTFIGTAPAVSSLSTLINDLANINDTLYTQSNSFFAVPTSGVYYMGWNCFSTINGYNLYLDDISITDASGINESNDNTGIRILS